MAGDRDAGGRRRSPQSRRASLPFSSRSFTYATPQRCALRTKPCWWRAAHESSLSLRARGPAGRSLTLATRGLAAAAPCRRAAPTTGRAPPPPAVAPRCLAGAQQQQLQVDEGDIEEQLDGLHDRVSRLRRVVGAIDDESKAQSALVAELEGAMLRTQAALRETLRKMNRIYASGGGGCAPCAAGLRRCAHRET